MNESKHCVVFSLDDRYFALPLSIVERIARAVAVTPLPKASDIIMGVINLQGRVIPVVNIRKRFSLANREISTEQHFIIGKTGDKDVAILVDNVHDIIEIPEKGFVSQNEIASNVPYISGIIKQEEEMILVHDLESLLSLDELSEVEALLEPSKIETKTKAKKSPKTSARKK